MDIAGRLEVCLTVALPPGKRLRKLPIVIQAESGVGEMQAATLNREESTSRLSIGGGPAARALRADASALPNPHSSPRGRGAQTAIVWGGLGFLAGVIFWHAMGFWSFLSNVVLNRPSQQDVAFASEPVVNVDRPFDDGMSAVIRVDPDNCTALALDRLTNRTVVRPCPENGLMLRLERKGGRDDLAELAVPTGPRAPDRFE